MVVIERLHRQLIEYKKRLMSYIVTGHSSVKIKLMNKSFVLRYNQNMN